MNIYVRRNMVEQWWEMCIETNRDDWQPVFDRKRDDFMEIMNPEIVKTNARLLWGGALLMIVRFLWLRQ